MYVGTVELYTKTTQGSRNTCSPKIGGLYTEVLYCSSVNIEDSSMMVT